MPVERKHDFEWNSRDDGRMFRVLGIAVRIPRPGRFGLAVYQSPPVESSTIKLSGWVDCTADALNGTAVFVEGDVYISEFAAGDQLLYAVNDAARFARRAAT